MKVIIVALAFVAVAAAATLEPSYKEPSKILRSAFDQSPEGGYVYGFETDDGTLRQETGELKTVQNEENKPQNVVVVKGSYKYIDPSGNTETVNYYADELGYHAEGPSIPKVAGASR